MAFIFVTERPWTEYRGPVAPRFGVAYCRRAGVQSGPRRAGASSRHVLQAPNKLDLDNGHAGTDGQASTMVSAQDRTKVFISTYDCSSWVVSSPCAETAVLCSSHCRSLFRWPRWPQFFVMGQPQYGPCSVASHTFKPSAQNILVPLFFTDTRELFYPPNHHASSGRPLFRTVLDQT